MPRSGRPHGSRREQRVEPGRFQRLAQGSMKELLSNIGRPRTGRLQGRLHRAQRARICLRTGAAQHVGRGLLEFRQGAALVSHRGPQIVPRGAADLRMTDAFRRFEKVLEVRLVLARELVHRPHRCRRPAQLRDLLRFRLVAGRPQLLGQRIARPHELRWLDGEEIPHALVHRCLPRGARDIERATAPSLLQRGTLFVVPWLYSSDRSGGTSRLRRAARLASATNGLRATPRRCSQPGSGASPGSAPRASGSKRSTSARTRTNRPGASACATRITFAGNPTVTNRSPRSQASTMRRAARSALSDTPGSAPLSENQATSSARFPLKSAFTYDPVRISPGTTVVTLTPSRASSTPRPSENPTIAYLAHVSGRRC